MDYYYCEYCEIAISETELKYHIDICNNFTKINKDEYIRMTEENMDVIDTDE